MRDKSTVRRKIGDIVIRGKAITIYLNDGIFGK